MSNTQKPNGVSDMSSHKPDSINVPIVNAPDQKPAQGPQPKAADTPPPVVK